MSRTTSNSAIGIRAATIFLRNAPHLTVELHSGYLSPYANSMLFLRADLGGCVRTRWVRPIRPRRLRLFDSDALGPNALARSALRPPLSVLQTVVRRKASRRRLLFKSSDGHFGFPNPGPATQSYRFILSRSAACALPRRSLVIKSRQPT